MTPVLLRVAAWASLVTTTVLSLLPRSEMVRTGMDGRIEHLAFYAGVAAIVTAAYAPRYRVPGVVAALVTYAGVLEIAQLFSLGRHSSVWDWLASSAGIVLGAIIAASAMRRIARA